MWRFSGIWVWVMFFRNLNPLISILSHFFTFKNLQTRILNQFQFHVTLHILQCEWCYYKVLQQVKIGVYISIKLNN
jgi:hypothetical protein